MLGPTTRILIQAPFKNEGVKESAQHALQELDRHLNAENHRFVEVCSRNYASEKQENHAGILTFRGRVWSFDAANLQQLRKGARHETERF